MKTARIHAAFETPASYSWSAAATLRHLDPAKDGVAVQFGGTDRFECPFEAEVAIIDKILTGAAQAFPGLKVADIDVFHFARASDAGLA